MEDIDEEAVFPYVDLKKIAEGAYGVVYKATNSLTGKNVAIKSIRILCPDQGVPSSAIREILLLKQLSHPNIIQMEKVITTARFIALVFEWGGSDLRKLMKMYSKIQKQKAQRKSQKERENRTFSMGTITRGLDPMWAKKILYQLLLSVTYCHKLRILHRDIKPENILVSKKGVVKLADFSLARSIGFQSNTRYTTAVVTLWYRAPEVLLGATHYSTSLDVWSIGCIFAEMIWGRPLFPGSDETQQLDLIFQVLGTPSTLDWPELTCLPGYYKVKHMKNYPRVRFSQLLGNWSTRGNNLLKQMLQLNPHRRISARDALDHPYFTELRTPSPTISLTPSVTSSPGTTTPPLTPSKFSFDSPLSLKYVTPIGTSTDPLSSTNPDLFLDGKWTELEASECFAHETETEQILPTPEVGYCPIAKIRPSFRVKKKQEKKDRTTAKEEEKSDHHDGMFDQLRKWLRF